VTHGDNSQCELWGFTPEMYSEEVRCLVTCHLKGGSLSMIHSVGSIGRSDFESGHPEWDQHAVHHAHPKSSIEPDLLRGRPRAGHGDANLLRESS
jgi:hypothetical protein